jgi:small subunit ribosomal protein S19
MSRPKWKGPFINNSILKKINSKQKNENFIISRNSEIIPSFSGLTFKVHNGNSYAEILVTDEMIGHKFGEFSFTRKKFVFKKKKTKK